MEKVLFNFNGVCFTKCDIGVGLLYELPKSTKVKFCCIECVQARNAGRDCLGYTVQCTHAVKVNGKQLIDTFSGRNCNKFSTNFTLQHIKTDGNVFQMIKLQKNTVHEFCPPFH